MDPKIVEELEKLNANLRAIALMQVAQYCGDSENTQLTKMADDAVEEATQILGWRSVEDLG